MQNHIASLLAFLLLTLISISYGASITGTITNPAGDSIPDVEVSLKDNYGPTTEYSDADGFYEFASTVTKGRYILEIFHGVDTIVDTINIEDDNDFITKDYVLEHAVAGDVDVAAEVEQRAGGGPAGVRVDVTAR